MTLNQFVVSSIYVKLPCIPIPLHLSKHEAQILVHHANVSGFEKVLICIGKISINKMCTLSLI